MYAIRHIGSNKFVMYCSDRDTNGVHLVSTDGDLGLLVADSYDGAASEMEYHSLDDHTYEIVESMW